MHLCSISVAVMALGDKSELPLLGDTSLPSLSAAGSSNEVDTDTQDCSAELELSDLVISPAVNTEDSGETVTRSQGMANTAVECDKFNVGESESVADTDEAIEFDTTAAAAASNSNYEAGADSSTNHGDVGSDSKGEVELLRICLLYTSPSPRD